MNKIKRHEMLNNTRSHNKLFSSAAMFVLVVALYFPYKNIKIKTFFIDLSKILRILNRPRSYNRDTLLSLTERSDGGFLYRYPNNPP